MDMSTMSWSSTIVFFAAIGFLIASRRSRPAGLPTYVTLLVIAFLGLFIGVDTQLLAIGDFEVPLNWAIVAASMGAWCGLLVCNHRIDRVKSA